MIVDPDFLTHWKTRALVEALEDECAPLYVLALWAHCQCRKTDRFVGLGADVFARVCRYPFKGDSAKFLDAMTSCGFIDIEGDTIIAHGWTESNVRLVTNWENGKRGGRPSQSHKQPSNNPAITHPKPNDNPNQSQLRGGSSDREDKIRVPPYSPPKGGYYHEGLNRVKRLFHKRETTPLDRAEQQAWSKAQSSVESTPEDAWLALEWTYAQRNGDVSRYRRKDMATLLNNWNGQIERSKAWKSEIGKSVL